MPSGFYQRKPFSEERKKAMSEIMKGNTYGFKKGHKFVRSKESYNNPETREKMRKARLGKCHTEETKQKISFSLKGRTPWNKNKKGVMSIPWNKGKKFSYKPRPKMIGNKNCVGRTPWNKGTVGIVRAWNKGIKNPKMSERQRGKNNPMYGRMNEENNPNWKGGITPTNEKIRKTFELQNWRMEVFKRDGFLCQMFDCDKTERYLNAHHIKTFAQNPDLRTDINNGITLCKKCHDRTKGKEEKFEKMFMEIIKISPTGQIQQISCTLKTYKP